MRSLSLFVCLALCGTLCSQPIILKNVNIVPVNQEILIPGCNIFIRDGIIEKITPYPYVKEPGRRAKKKDSTVGYIIYDCEGAYVIPGLADMHAHLPTKESPITLQDHLRLSLAAGVTEVRSMRGERSQLPIRDSVAKGLKKNSPELFISYVLEEKDSVINKETAEKRIAEAKEKGFNFIKYLGGMKKESMRHISAACKKENMPLAGHAFDGSLAASLDAGFASVEHYQPVLKEYKKGVEPFRAMMDTMKAHKMALCPTLSFYHIYNFSFTREELLKRNGMEYAGDKVKKAWEQEYEDARSKTKEHFKENFEAAYRKKNADQLEEFGRVLKILADAQVCLLLSPDDCEYNVPGYAMYEEMMLYKKAGLSNYQVLKAATFNAAKCLKDNSWGSVEVGKKANLVVLKGNPLEKLDYVKEVQAVVLHGKYWKPEELVKPK